jgi:hypothetical protein
MRLEKKVKTTSYGYRCDNCDELIEAPSDRLEDRPTGYYLQVERITGTLNRYISEILFFHSKECLLNAMQFKLSHLMERRD